MENSLEHPFAGMRTLQRIREDPFRAENVLLKLRENPRTLESVSIDNECNDKTKDLYEFLSKVINSEAYLDIELSDEVVKSACNDNEMLEIRESLSRKYTNGLIANGETKKIVNEVLSLSNRANELLAAARLCISETQSNCSTDETKCTLELKNLA